MKYQKSMVDMMDKEQQIKDGDLSSFSFDQSCLDLAPFDRIFFGTPTWGSTPASALYGFWKNCQHIQGKEIINFTTCRAIGTGTIIRMDEEVKKMGGIPKKGGLFKGLFKIKLDEVKTFVNSLECN